MDYENYICSLADCFLSLKRSDEKTGSKKYIYSYLI